MYVNYESELQGLFIKRLVGQYGIKKEQMLYPYMQLRFRFWKMLQPTSHYPQSRQFIEFLLEELNLPKQGFYYKGMWIDKGFSLENSLTNIIEAWDFEQTLRSITDEKGKSYDVMDYVEIYWEKFLKKAKNKAKIFKTHPYYTWYLVKEGLAELNQVFGITISTSFRIKDVTYPDEHDDFYRTIEEKCDAYVHTMEWKRHDTKTVQEQDVEQFLRYRLHLIEDGLRYIDHQFPVTDGRIDILAKDRNQQYVVIELKVTDHDPTIIWQCMYYPQQIKLHFSTPHVRMITLAPSYKDSILTPLKELKFVEIMTYTPVVELGEIKSLSIQSMNEKALI